MTTLIDLGEGHENSFALKKEEERKIKLRKMSKVFTNMIE